MEIWNIEMVYVYISYISLYFFIPAIPRSELKKMHAKEIEKSGLKIRLVKNSGMSQKRQC